MQLGCFRPAKYMNVETLFFVGEEPAVSAGEAHAPIKGDRYGAVDRQAQKTLVYSAREERMRWTVVHQQDVL